MADNKIKSLAGNTSSYVSFVNRHFREASVFWYNFEGDLIKYSTLKPNESYGVKTFVEHPWTAKDTATEKNLILDNQSDEQCAFYPRENKSHETIYIDTPKDFPREREGSEASLQFVNPQAVPIWIRKKIEK